MKNKLIFLIILIAGFFLMSANNERPKPHKVSEPLWDVEDYLIHPPKVTWGEKINPFVQEVFYEGEPYKGKPSRVFAYLGKPAGKAPFGGKFPAILLIHGGGGKAFSDWAELWAKRGYVALAMDLGGHGPDGPLADGGPNQSDDEKFRAFTIEDGDYKNMWTYQCVAAILRGHALLIAQKEVDPDKIVATGISWGGYLACILAGIDNQLQTVVPVYGCGFLHENSFWEGNRFGKGERYFEKMTPELQERWTSLFDPSSYLGQATMPMLFVTGTNDGFYPLDSYQKTYLLPKGEVTLSITLRREHAHIFTFGEVDAFIDHIIFKDAKSLPEISVMKLNNDKNAISVTYESETPVSKAELAFTTDTGIWINREWKAIPATISGNTVSVEMPVPAPTCYYILLTDERGLPVSSKIEIVK
jgi:dienelactone hydrolase